MAKLYPPILEGTVPAQSGKQLTIPYQMNPAVSLSEVKGFSLRIYGIPSGQLIGNSSIEAEKTEVKNFAFFNLPNDLSLNIGQYYRIQIAYYNTADEVGYYSTSSVMKYTADDITVQIENLEEISLNPHVWTYKGIYSHINDLTEKEYSYKFTLLDENLEVIETTGEMIHNIENDTESDKSVDIFYVDYDLKINKKYYLTYWVKTVNEVEYTSPTYIIYQASSVDIPNNEIDEVKAELNPEEGNIKVTLKCSNAKAKHTLSGAYRLLRASDKEDFSIWHEIDDFQLLHAPLSDYSYTDFSIEQGVKYQYAIQQHAENSFNLSDVMSFSIDETDEDISVDYKYYLVSNYIKSEVVYADFEYLFLTDSERQLKIKFNPQVSTFKDNIIQSKIDTIGSKYPYIFQNGQIKYKEFQISGLLSYLSDSQDLFTNKNWWELQRFTNKYFPEDEEERKLNEFIGNNYSFTDLNANNFKQERDFKLEVLDWLNNGKPKLLRSAGEGNYFVQIMNPSLSPVDSLGRMLHNFSATAYEIADFNFKSLRTYGFIQNNRVFRGNVIEMDSVNLGSVESFYSLDMDDKISLSQANILEGKNCAECVAFSVTNAKPGTILWIKLKDGQLTKIKINFTGNYYFNFTEALSNTESLVRDSLSIRDMSVEAIYLEQKQDQGVLRYYYSPVKDEGALSNLMTKFLEQIPLEQYNDIKNNIEDFVKDKILVQYNKYSKNSSRQFASLASIHYLKFYIDTIDENNKNSVFELKYRQGSKKNDKVINISSDNPALGTIQYLNLNSIFGKKGAVYIVPIEDLEDIETFSVPAGSRVEVGYSCWMSAYSPDSSDSNLFEEETVKDFIGYIFGSLGNWLFPEEG